MIKINKKILIFSVIGLIILLILGVIGWKWYNKNKLSSQDNLFAQLKNIKLSGEELIKVEKTKDDAIKEKTQIDSKRKETLKKATEALTETDDIEALKKKFGPGTKARADWIAKRKAEGKWSDEPPKIPTQ